MKYPVIMTTVGDAYAENANIMKIIWECDTTAADTAVIVTNESAPNEKQLWKGRAIGDETYLSESFGPHGLHAPDGFRVKTLAAGTLTIYLGEV